MNILRNFLSWSENNYKCYLPPNDIFFDHFLELLPTVHLKDELQFI
jgi:hypothetical protein